MKKLLILLLSFSFLHAENPTYPTNRGAIFLQKLLPALFGAAFGACITTACSRKKADPPQLWEMERAIMRRALPARASAMRIIYGLYINMNEPQAEFAVNMNDHQGEPPFGPTQNSVGDDEETSLVVVTPVFYTPDNVRHTGFAFDYNPTAMLSETMSVDAGPGMYKIGYIFEFNNAYNGLNALQTSLYVLTDTGMTVLPEINQSYIDQFGPNVTMEWTNNFEL
jgi:hypothetical protein